MSATIQLQSFLNRTVLPKSNESQVVYVMLVATPEETHADVMRMPMNLCLVLDRSLSMRGDRLNQVKEAACRIVDRLDKTDFFSLVTFNDHAQVVIPSQPVSNRDNLKNLIYDIEAAGGTEMATGLKKASTEIQRTLMIHGISHVILLTDGRTYGDEAECLAIARHLQSHHIGLTALGIGDEWNEDLLEMMAASENSHTRYITTAQDITEVFAEEMKRMSATFAQKVQLLLISHSDSTVRSIDRVQPYISPIPMKSEHAIRWMGNLGNWQSTDPHVFVLEVVVPPLEIGDHHLLQIVLRYQMPESEQQEQQQEMQLTVTIGNTESVSSESDLAIKHWMERLTAYRLQAKAWKNVETGAIDEAAEQLMMAGTRLFEAGEIPLASTIQEEATRLLKSGRASSEGRKRIKYGTRGLIHQSVPLQERESGWGK